MQGKSSRPSTPDVARLLYGKRRNAVHKTSQAKPSVTTALMQTANEQLAAAVKHALRMKELGRDDVAAVFRSHRALRRPDRTQIVVEALREESYPLTSHHYALLMAHANDQRDTATALRYWGDAVRVGKVHEKLHGALLATYRNAGDWEKATKHCEKMWEDKLVVDPHSLHAVINACRRYGPWEAGLAAFSTAVSRGTRPNSVVYLELLRLIQHSKLPGRSVYAAAILDALDGKADVTAGHYNAVLATMGGIHQWARGVQLFHSMKEKNVQPSRDTLHTLLLLNPNNISHCIRCVAEAHALGMPVTDTMYRAVLSNLFRLRLDHEASQFAEREYRRDVENAGNGLSTSLMLSMAMLDSLLAHPRPHDALLFYESFEKELGSVVGPSTRGLGTFGQLSQRWLVQGRVAVVDHNVVLSPRFESLIFHYDSIFIPFSAVRLLVRRARELGNTHRAVYTRTAIRQLQLLLQQPGWSAVRVLPFAHQLLAHQYVSGGPTSAESLRLLREEATTTKALPTLGGRLRHEFSDDTGEANGILTIRSPGEGLPITAQQKKKATASLHREIPTTRQLHESFLHDKDRISSAERVVAVAAMLRALNPETDIHVLSSNATQLAVVEHWNTCQPTTPLTPVQHPEELHEKAPPEEEANVEGVDERTSQFACQ